MHREPVEIGKELRCGDWTRRASDSSSDSSECDTKWLVSHSGTTQHKNWSHQRKTTVVISLRSKRVAWFAGSVRNYILNHRSITKDQLISTVPSAHHSVKGNWWHFWTRNVPLRYMLLSLMGISCNSPLIRNTMMTQLKMAEQKIDRFTNWIVDMMKHTHRSYFTQTLLLGCVTIWHQWLSYEALILMSLFFVGLPNDAIFPECVKCCLSAKNDGQLWDCTPLSA